MPTPEMVAVLARKCSDIFCHLDPGALQGGSFLDRAPSRRLLAGPALTGAYALVLPVAATGG